MVCQSGLWKKDSIQIYITQDANFFDRDFEGGKKHITTGTIAWEFMFLQ